jgi:signal peptidase II
LEKFLANLKSRPGSRLLLVAFLIFGFDQLTKMAVLRSLGYLQEQVVIEGFFNLVHWGNTGAAWSLFNQYPSSNLMLAAFGLVALLVLYVSRHHFEAHTLPGQMALGLIFGGIAGNLLDRLLHGHVIDFLYFYAKRRGGGEIGFPAFNVADSAICIGVLLLFLMSWQKEPPPDPADSSSVSRDPSQVGT